VVVFDDGRWRSLATGRFVRMAAGPADLPCRLCGLEPTQEGYDACLGHLAGATSACCGHGVQPGWVVTVHPDGTREVCSLPMLSEPDPSPPESDAPEPRHLFGRSCWARP
jgi:hypothetical protein